MTDERTRARWRRASARYRERHPELVEQARERMALYRATHPAQAYITNLRARRRREAQRRDSE